jgi:hypothetical protein
MMIPFPSIWEFEYNSGTILCSRNHGCPSRSFWVVWIKNKRNTAQVKRYSSELGIWENLTETTPMLAEIDNRPTTLIGGILYWPMKSKYIISFNNAERVLKYIEYPHQTHDIFRRNLHIFKGHNGDVALAVDTSILHHYFVS